jgi:nucleotide-binding universal stress UspA family protein
MIKDILVVMDSASERAGPFALSLAREVNACLAAVSVTAAEPFEPLYYSEARFDLVEAAQGEAIELASVAAETFAERAKASDLNVNTTTISGGHEVERKLLALCQTYDLVIFEQFDSDIKKPVERYLEPILLRSGRPTIVVPYFYVRPAAFETITVAWDGSAPCARALADAIPLLQRASNVSVVRVVRDEFDDRDEIGPRLVQHLARHGVDAQFRELSSTIPVAETLLSHVADAGSDLLVMGAYGHSRLREAILGGASRGILKSMTVPIFMSH